MTKAAMERLTVGCEYQPDRAVIDIGSNTVRLVVYSGCEHAPQTWLNEKVSARLGRELSSSGRMPEKAIGQALRGLERYALILRDLGIEDVQTVATAAVRDAKNGPEFLEQVRTLGLAPRLLTGEEEAQISALGVIGAFPGAQGTVADLGGGSLELVMIEHGDSHDGVSLSLGTLRLPVLRERGSDAFQKAIRKEMSKAGWASAHPGPLYMVGGTWRALAAYSIRKGGCPVSDPHALALDLEQALGLAKEVARMPPEALADVPGISASRASGLPDAAAMLRVMLSELQPDGIVFSSWGLREGLLFRRLRPEARSDDPLLAAVAEFSHPRGGDPVQAIAIADWTAHATSGHSRTRLAAIMLSLAARHVEPDLRARHAYEWAIDKRWVGLDLPGRAQIAAALLAACGKIAPPPQLERLADWSLLSEAIGWGLAIRLCQRFSAGARAALDASSLRREGGKLVLSVAKDHAPLVSDRVIGDLKILAQCLDLEPEFRKEGAAVGSPIRCVRCVTSVASSFQFCDWPPKFSFANS